MFLQEKIRFLDIPEIIEKVMGRHSVKPDPDIDDIMMSICGKENS